MTDIGCQPLSDRSGSLATKSRPMGEQEPRAAIDISLAEVTSTLAARIRLYRWRRPTYQTALLRSLRRGWRSSHKAVLDVGGGTGIIAQSVKDLFEVDRVVSIDVENRYLDSLDIETRTYDGRTLPFDDDTFDCVLLCNVLHHVPREARVALLRECRRVTRRGTIYIKDHIAQSRLDHLRLMLLDVIGNVPFGGMVDASYLETADWQSLAAESGFRIDWQDCDRYRDGIMAGLFPNRLEVVMRWRDVARQPEVDR
ncbi:MAG TPA: class I SAM-dependent methyltransferase [Xanthobacteraceae bacterium]|jgi:ubiquinone/menaquinone biosynthesis C-methylase UbiE|nr:class I SAM-dependent methyltransferase [Xanthobacteraceae bacterium]